MQKKIYLFSTSKHPKTISINSLDINFLSPYIDFKKYDYFIITSKQTTKALLNYKNLILKPALCISNASASSYKDIGGEILDIGKGYGDNLIKKIQQYPKNKKWLYLRAKIVASDFVEKSKSDGYDIDETIIYESSCSKDILNAKIDKNSFLIFTSPSSVKCFLKNNNIDKTHKVIVIGKTTAKALPFGIKYTISNKTNIESCIKATKENKFENIEELISFK